MQIKLYCALHRRNAIGLAGGKLLHDVAVGVLRLSGSSDGEGVRSDFSGGGEWTGCGWDNDLKINYYCWRRADGGGVLRVHLIEESVVLLRDHERVALGQRAGRHSRTTQCGDRSSVDWPVVRSWVGRVCTIFVCDRGSFVT